MTLEDALAKGTLDLNSPISEMVNNNPIYINEECLAVKALELMENNGKEINVLPVLNQQEVFLWFYSITRFN